MAHEESSLGNAHRQDSSGMPCQGDSQSVNATLTTRLPYSYMKGDYS